jgi:hypothetical protein
MRHRPIFGLVMVLVLLFAAGAFALGQKVKPPSFDAPRVQVGPPPSSVFSGADVGFRVEGYRDDGTPYGRVVVRIDGKWIGAELGPSPMRVVPIGK